MASVSSDTGGGKRVQFTGLAGKRQTIRLGLVPVKHADAVARKVEALVAAKHLSQQPDRETAVWLADLPAKLRDRLVVLGLAEPAGKQAHTLADLMREFLANLDVKPWTLTMYRQTERCLFDALGPGRPLADIGPLDADKFRRGLLDAGLAAATVSKRVKTARQAFKQAVRWGWLAANPFADVRAGAQTNRARMCYVSDEQVLQVIHACPDAEWRLIVALARFAGLRCPSEVLRLTWNDVQWDIDRFTVHASKTEHHAHGGVRQVPIFSKLRPFLQDAFDAAEPGEPRVITRYRAGSNLQPQLVRLIKRAGLVPWPKAFNNLRSSLITDLAAVHPLHVLTQWVGNSPEIARLHYTQVTEADYAKAAQNPAQHPPATAGIVRQPAAAVQQKSPVLPGLSAHCQSVPTEPVSPTGFEPVSPP